MLKMNINNFFFNSKKNDFFFNFVRTFKFHTRNKKIETVLKKKAKLVLF